MRIAFQYIWSLPTKTYHYCFTFLHTELQGTRSPYQLLLLSREESWYWLIQTLYGKKCNILLLHWAICVIYFVPTFFILDGIVCEWSSKSDICILNYSSCALLVHYLFLSMCVGWHNTMIMITETPLILSFCCVASIKRAQ